MLLALDVGNTNTVLGLYQLDVEPPQLAAHWRVTTHRTQTVDEYGVFFVNLFEMHGLSPKQVTHIIISSVVPPVESTLRQMCENYFQLEPLFVEPGIKTGMPILYENPAEVGADRIVNGVGAWERFGRVKGRPMIVVDFGTATTFDAISAKGEYLGGAICPGVQISADALFQRAARLPRIDVRKPPRIVGRTTVGAMESGLFYGYVGMVEGLVKRMADELGGHVVCVATGGLADVIAPETPLIHHVDPNLTLHGLRLVWERNQ